MLFHFPVLMRRSLNSQRKIFGTQILESDKKAIMSEMAVKPCRSVLASLFSIILDRSLVMKQPNSSAAAFVFFPTTLRH